MFYRFPNFIINEYTTFSNPFSGNYVEATLKNIDLENQLDIADDFKEAKLGQN